MITRQQCVLVCFAFCSTPARSCSEELFHHSTALAGNVAAAPVVATGPVNTSGKHPPATDREDARTKKGVAGTQLVTDAEQGQKRASRTLTSSKHITTASPSHFLPLPAATATATKEKNDTGRRKARALSESDDPQGGTSWLDSNPPAT